MARSIWGGSIGFGLVNVPVKLYPAVSQKEVRFHMLHAKDGGRIHQKRVCSVDEKEVAWDDIAKGYEVAPDRFVMVTREELESFDPKATRTIEIADFVELEDIDPIYYEQTYYLAPDRGAGKAYALLLAAMEKTGKVAIARMVLRTKQYLCAVRPMGKALALSTLLYADEIVRPEEIESLHEDGPKPAPKEIAMAEQLIGALSTAWKPERYKDEYREKVLELLDRKAEGEAIVSHPEAAPSAKIVNLADALRESLRARKGEYRPRDEEASRPAARRGRTKHKKKE